MTVLYLTVWGYTNPVIDSNNPDPAALALPGGGYLAVATSNYATNSAAEDAFPIYHSANLVDWELRGHVFPAGAWPAYCDRNMWAPEIHRVNGRCVELETKAIRSFAQISQSRSAFTFKTLLRC